MAKLADGEELNLETGETVLEKGMDVDEIRPPSPGGTGDPVLFDQDTDE
jgi:hypothetical protein